MLAVNAAKRVGTLVSRLRSGGLAGDSAWGVGLELVTMVSSLLTFFLLARSLGPEGYGGYVALYSIVGPLVTLCASGVTLALLQHVVRDREPIAETARSCVSITLLTGAVLTVVGVWVAMLVVDDISNTAIVSVLVTEFVTTPLLMVGATAVQASERYRGAAQIRITLFAVRIAIVIGLFVAGNLTITSLAVGVLISSSTLAVVVLARVGRRYGFWFGPGRVRVRHLRTNLVFSVGISAASLNNEGDKFVLTANNFKVDTGLYGAAYRIVNLGMVPVSSLIDVTHRTFLEHEEGVKGQHLRRAIRFARVAGAYGFVVGLLLILVAPLLPIAVGDKFEGSVAMVRWLAPIILLRALTMFPLNALMGLGHTLLRSVVIVSNAVIAIVLYVVLIPAHSWKGAVAGTLISETLEMLSIWGALVWCQRKDDQQIDAARRAGHRDEADDVAAEAETELIAAAEIEDWNPNV